MTWLRPALAAAVLLLLGNLPAAAATAELGRIGGNFVLVAIFAVVLAVMFSRRAVMGEQRRLGAGRRARFIIGVPLIWLALALLHATTGLLESEWLVFPLWAVLAALFVAWGHRLLPGSLRRLGAFLFPRLTLDTHGSAHFGTAAIGARHLAPAAPADGFALGLMPDVSRRSDARFRQDGHILTCAPTGAGKGIGAVIPNLLAYPGSAFVLDFKGENYAVTARARRELGQHVVVVDPFGITGQATHALNWLVSRAAGLADMLIVAEGADADSHWNDTARELLRGLLVYVAGLPADRRSMAELRRIVTASEADLAGTLADMRADPESGQRIPTRAAAAHLNRPERERGSVLSTVVRHTAWLDDPRLCAALTRSDFDLADLKRRPMTAYLAIPPDRLRACLGFVRGFVGLALDGVTTVPGKPLHRVAFFLDEFGQLGRMDRLADSVTLLRGYGAQLWLFVQDLSQLKAVYPRWQSFLANTSQQFFGTADFDSARYLSGALGQETIRYETQSVSTSTNGLLKPGSFSSGSGEHLQGRALLTPDEVMRLGPTRPIVLVSGEPPYLLDRIN